MDYKEMMQKLPSNWGELKLKDYQKLLDLEIVEDDDMDNLFVGADNTLKVLAALTNTSFSVIETMPLGEISPLANRISFIQTLPERKKEGKIKWKKLEEVKYNDYITFLTLAKQPLHNMHLILKDFSINKMSEEDALELGMDEVYCGFFLLLKQSKKLISNSIKTLALRVIKNKIKQTILTLYKKNSKVKSN